MRWRVIIPLALYSSGWAIANDAPLPGSDMDEAAIPAEADVGLVPLEDGPESADVERVANPGPRSRLIEEVVVTAQRREQSFQKVPISISAFSQDQLDAAGIVEIREVDRVTPGLTFTQSFGFHVVFLRGVGTNAFLPSADPSVPIYVDGVNLLSGQGVKNTLGRIRRVEILKGPQGTLFGRNALGGAINIITHPPDDSRFAADVKLEMGNFNRRSADVYLNIPIADGLAASLVGAIVEADSYYTYEGDVPEIDVFQRGVRGRLRWDATDNVYVDLGASYERGSDTGGMVQENTRPTPIIGALIPADPQADRRVNHNTTSGVATETYLFNARAGWKMRWFDTDIIFSQQRLDVLFARLDFDASPLPIASFDGGNETPGVIQFAEQFTAELQLLSNDRTPFSGWLEWVAGVYYLESEGGLDPVIFQVGRDALGATPFAGFTEALDTLTTAIGLEPLSDGVTLLTKGILDTRSISGFLQGTISLPGRLDLTLGGRIDSESRDLVGGLLGVRSPLGGNELVLSRFPVPEVTTQRFAPRIALNWAASDNINIYGSYSVGHLSPTYNTANFFSAPDIVDEAESRAYELGVKGLLFSGSLKMDAAIFQTKLSDMIVGFFGLTSGGVVRFDNAGDGKIEGAELSFQWQPMPSLNPGLGVFGSGSYLDAVYTRYPDGRGFDESTGLAFGDGGFSPLPSRDFSGNRIVNTPEFSGTLGIGQRMAVGRGEVEIGADVYYNDGYFFSSQNSDLETQPSYSLFNARLHYLYEPWGLEIGGYVQNIMNSDYFVQVIQHEFGRVQALASPRTYGLRVKLAF